MGLGKAVILVFVPDPGRIRRQSVADGQDGGVLLVLNGDGVQRLLHQSRGLRRDQGDEIAAEAGPVSDIAVRAAGDVLFHICRGQHAADAGDGPGAACVDGDDPAAGDPGTFAAAVEHIRQVHIRGVAGAAGDFLVSVRPGRCRAQNVKAFFSRALHSSDLGH